MNIFKKKVLGWSLFVARCASIASCQILPEEETLDGYNLIHQNGPTLGYSPESGITILYERNFAFKDLNRNGILDKYEDWRLKPEERAKDLARQMRLPEIAGLMLYSDHQAIPNSLGWTPATWDGKSFDESGAKPWELTDQQKGFLEEEHIRHILITTIESPEVAARWNNEVQAYAEKLRLGIPTNNSSDPRHSADNSVEYKAGGGGKISMWPNELGMGATFDPELMYKFGEIASAEYRALGFTTSLSPQIDIATDPRWMRFDGTYGEDPILVKDMAIAYCDAFQTSTWFEGKKPKAWGPGSVNVMAKHWPGGGPGEGGRDAHFGRGKFAVYPNNNIELHKFPFTEGAFKLKNGTEKAAAVMPYYTISYGISNVNVANNFNKEIIEQQLRKDTGFDGVVCTDWAVTADEYHPGIHNGKPWGVEEFSVAERHYMALIAGVDQFGGNNDKEPVLEAFEMIQNIFGEASMLERVHKSAERLLLNMFRTGLFENPYLDPNKTAEVVGNPSYMKAGYDAQIKSIVMLKNNGKALPVKEDKSYKVYIPNRHLPKHANLFGGFTEEQTIDPISSNVLSNYYRRVNDPKQADFAVVFIDSPMSGWGLKASETLSDPLIKKMVIKKMFENGALPSTDDVPIERLVQEDDIYFKPSGTKIPEPNNGYYPISLQYSDYVATEAREHSIAGGDPYEEISNRSYLGKGVRTINKEDMLIVQETREKMGDKRVIVVINCKNPMVMSEIEPYCDAILLTFSVQNQAILDIISGRAEPSALLPFQMPATMATVEIQAEDTPHDMNCYVDEVGNIYDFAFGMNWSGKIDDERVKKYAVKHDATENSLDKKQD